MLFLTADPPKKIEIYAYLDQSKWDKKDKYEYLKND